MKKRWVICYWADMTKKVYTQQWQDVNLGIQIIKEAGPYSIQPPVEEIPLNKPKEDYLYATIEKRYYKGNDSND